MAGNLDRDAPPAARQPQPPRGQYPPVQYPQGQYPQASAAQAPHSQAPHSQAPHSQAPHSQAPHSQAPHWQAERAPHPPLGIDPEIWPIIRQSAARLARDENAFIQQLHYDITQPISDPAGVPAGDIWVFCQRMVQSLLWAALTDQPLGVVADMLRKVGAQNWVDGFPDTLYGDVAHALVQTVHYLSAYDWSASMGSAWISYFMWIRPHLLAGAQQAAAQHVAAQQAAEQQAATEWAAAEREAARVKALSRDSRGGHTQMVGDVNLESVASLLDDDDNENVGYGQIMVSMTRNPRQEPPRRPS
jgi:hypothetical protein